MERGIDVMVRGGTNSALFVALMLFIVLAAVAVLVGVMAHLGWLLVGVLVDGVRRLLRRRARDGVNTPCPDPYRTFVYPTTWVPPVPRQRGRVYQSRRSHPGG